jgi:hypothetical protein
LCYPVADPLPGLIENNDDDPVSAAANPRSGELMITETTTAASTFPTPATYRS